MSHFSECVGIVLSGNDDSCSVLHIRWCVHLILSAVLEGYTIIALQVKWQKLKSFTQISLLDMGRASVWTTSLNCRGRTSWNKQLRLKWRQNRLKYRIKAYEPGVYHWLLSCVPPFPERQVTHRVILQITSYMWAHSENFKLFEKEF